MNRKGVKGLGHTPALVEVSRVFADVSGLYDCLLILKLVHMFKKKITETSETFVYNLKFI